MAFRLNVGQYFDAPSPIHALDARVKLCCALAGMVGLFCAATPAQLLLGAVFTLAVVAASRVPVGRVAASVRPLVVFLGVLSLFNLVFVQTGEALLAAGPLTITAGGVWAAVLYTIRFGLALMLGGLILLTTTPTQLSDAFDRMMAPLARLGLPAHEGGPLRRIRAIVPVVVALLASCLRHADGLSRALDARCYEGGEDRTHLHEQRLGRRDAVATAITLAFLAALVALG